MNHTQGKPQCCGSVRGDGWGRPHQCARSGTLEHEGKLYCKTHHPPTVKAKDEERSARWRAEWAAEKAASEKKSAEAAEIKSKAAEYDAIKAERDRRKFNGVFISGKWIHTDTYSRTQWVGMVMMGAGIPAIPWTTMDNTTITTSQALAGAVFQGIAQLDAALFAYAKSLIDQVDVSSEPQNIDIMTGWPTTFGEVV